MVALPGNPLPAAAAARPFDAPVPKNGYAWWYLDAFSDDGAHAITVIAFVGSVFSPYYAQARRRGPADPSRHCALNVALYGRPGARWAMTERGSAALLRTPTSFAIGPSVLAWEAGALVLELDEIAVPLPRRLQGRIKLYPGGIPASPIALDERAEHHWQPLAPISRVEVELAAPRWSWQGHGYLDANYGSVPLETTFHGWDWARCRLSDEETVLGYEVAEVTGRERQVALRCTPTLTECRPALPRHALPGTLWGIGRRGFGEHGTGRVIRTLEDTPFYARSEVVGNVGGRSAAMMHESLDLRRFARRWVQVLLPFRMPRRGGPIK